MVISDGIPTVPRNRNSRNSVPNPSAEENTTRNFVPWNWKRSKLSEFPSKPFSGRENSSEPVFLNIHGAQKSIPRNEFRQPIWPFGPVRLPYSYLFRSPIDFLQIPALNSVPWSKNRSKLSEFRSEPYRGRENNSGQNAAAAVSSFQIESSCGGRKIWFPPTKSLYYSMLTNKLCFRAY
jgi:hypothetical protein